MRFFSCCFLKAEPCINTGYCCQMWLGGQINLAKPMFFVRIIFKSRFKSLCCSSTATEITVLLYESGKCENFHIGTKFQHYGNFLLHKLNSCGGNYSREDNISGNMVSFSETLKFYKFNPDTCTSAA